MENDKTQSWKEKYITPKKPRTGKKVAVIGGGATGYDPQPTTSITWATM